MRFVDGYTLDVCLHAGQIYTVWRGRRDTDLTPIAVKYINLGCESLELVTRLRREYECFLKLKGTVAPRAIDFLEHPEGPVFVVEDTGSKTLACEILRGPFDHKTFLYIATGLVRAVRVLHAEGLIHRTLTTSSILLDSKKIVRFGDLDGVFDQNNPETLPLPADLSACIESAKIRDSPNYSDDYHALGYIFLSMITGVSLPIQSSSAHHLLDGPDLPKPFVVIIKKLLSILPEEHYLSLDAVEADLQSCQAPQILQIHETPIIRSPYNSMVGTKNAYMTERLHGRSRELETLRQLREEAANGDGQFVIVCGPPGIGKTQLILNAVQTPMRTPTPILLISFGQKSHSTPYDAFVTAVTDYLQNTLQQTEATFHTLRACLDAIPEEEISVLCDLIPSLTLFSGHQPPPRRLPTCENKIRLSRAILHLLEALTHPSRPLTVLFEDLHAADTSSLALIQFILSGSNFRHLLFIGTVREDKIGTNEHILSLLERRDRQGHMVPLMTLGTLCVDDMTLLLADLFKGSLPKIEDLAKILTSYSGGNPFWALTALQLWKAKKKITFNYETWTWSWSKSDLKELNAQVTIQESLSDCIKNLGSSCFDILLRAACCGVVFDIHDLAYVKKISCQQILESLEPALNIHLIRPHSGKNADISPFFFRFRHDIIRDHVLSLTTLEEREVIHLELGMAFYERCVPGDTSDGLFKALDHLHTAKVKKRRPDILKNIAEASHQASRRAASVSCHTVSHTHAELGLEYLGARPWDSVPDLGRHLFYLQAEAAFVLGYQDNLQNLIARFLKDTNDAITAAPALEYLIFILSREGQNYDVMSLVSQALGRVGLDVQDKKSALSRFWAHIHLTWLTYVLINTPPLPRPQSNHRAQALASLLFTAATTCYPLGPLLSGRGMITMVHLALRTKEAKLLAAAHATAVMRMAQQGYTRFSEHLAKRTIELSQPLPPCIMSVRAKIAACYLGLHWSYSLKDIQILLRQCIYESQRIADYRSTITAMSISVELALYRGMSLPQLMSDLAEALSLCQHIDRKNHNFWLSTVQRLCRLLIQDGLKVTDIAAIFEREQNVFEDALLSASPVLANASGTVLIFGATLLGEYDHAQKMAQRLTAVAKKAEGTAAAAQYDWLSAIAVLKSHGLTEKKRYKKVRPLLKTLRERADIGATNHLQRFLLIQAEIARFQKKWDIAESLYTRAFQAATDNQLYADQIISCLLAASFHEEHHQPHIALSWRHQAIHISKRWGADGLVSLFYSRWPELQDRITDLQRHAGIDPTEAQGHAEQLPEHPPSSTHVEDMLLAALHATRILSGERHKPDLLRGTLRFAAHLTQAERGLLLLHSHKGWTIEVESCVTSDQHIKVEKCTRYVKIEFSHEESLSSLSPAIFLHATHTKKPVVLGNAHKVGAFTLDPYIGKNNILSLICMPLMQDDAVIGVLWLESWRHTNLFTPPRVTALSQIAAQAVICLENVRTYAHIASLNQSLENHVEEYIHTLNTKNQLVDSLLEATPDALISCDEKGYLIAWNRRACDILGVSNGFLTHETHLPSLLANIRELHPLGGDKRPQGPLPPEKKEHGSDDHVTHMPVADGRTLRVYRQRMHHKGYVYIFRDVTDELQTQQELKEARQQATKALSDLHSAHHNLVQSEKMASLGELVAGVVHEVSTPIGTALTAASFLTGRAKSIRDHLEKETLKKSDLDSFIAQLSDMTFAMVNSMERASDLIESFKRVAVDRSTEEETTFLLAPHIKTTCQSFTPLINRAGHRLQIRCPPDLKVHSRPGVLSQILSNFITNALAHAYDTGQKGVLTISATCPDTETVRIVFTDDGKGIPPELLDRVFDPFFTTKRGSGGSGLGLSIAYNLVTGALGGTLSVTSRIGEGTQFTVVLPMHPSKNQEHENQTKQNADTPAIQTTQQITTKTSDKKTETPVET